MNTRSVIKERFKIKYGREEYFIDELPDNLIEKLEFELWVEGDSRRCIDEDEEKGQ